MDFKLCIKNFDIGIENISHKSWTIHARFQPSNTQLYFITADGYRCQDNFRANSITVVQSPTELFLIEITNTFCLWQAARHQHEQSRHGQKVVRPFALTENNETRKKVKKFGILSLQMQLIN